MNMKKGGAELSPGSRKNAHIQKSKKVFYGEDDENDITNPDLYFNASIFNKDSLTSSSSQSFNSSNLYGQQPTSSSLGFGSNSSVIGPATIGGRLISTSVGSNIAGHITPTNTAGSVGMNLPQAPSNSNSSSNSFGVNSPLSSGINLPGNIGLQASGQGLPQQQSSPNSRSIISMPGSRGILGQRQIGSGVGAIASGIGSNLDIKRSAINLSGPINGNALSVGMSAMGFGMSSHGPRGFGSTQGMMGNFPNSMSSAFSGNSGLDLSEFPSLNNRAGRVESGGSNTPNLGSNLMPGRQPYVGMVKQPVSESNEFQIHSEDFPALPGSQGLPDGVNIQANSGEGNLKSTMTSVVDNVKDGNNRFGADKNAASGQKRGIQTSSDGIVTNIPAGMVMDQFGMVGLLTFIRAAETDPNLVTLALGSDLTTLGLNLNSPDNLYPNFGGPWAEIPCRPQDVDYHVPQEYLTNISIREKLAPVKLNRYGEDLLFYIFYTNGGDLLQIAAALEL
ncbi:CNOT2 (predicted) [Pycnogonum litorale]